MIPPFLLNLIQHHLAQDSLSSPKPDKILNNSVEKETFLQNLKEGQIIEGILIKRTNEVITIKHNNTTTITAKGNVPANIGDRIKLKVIKNSLPIEVNFISKSSLSKERSISLLAKINKNFTELGTIILKSNENYEKNIKKDNIQNFFLENSKLKLFAFSKNTLNEQIKKAILFNSPQFLKKIQNSILNIKSKHQKKDIPAQNTTKEKKNLNQNLQNITEENNIKTTTKNQNSNINNELLNTISNKKIITKNKIQTNNIKIKSNNNNNNTIQKQDHKNTTIQNNTNKKNNENLDNIFYDTKINNQKIKNFQNTKNIQNKHTNRQSEIKENNTQNMIYNKESQKKDKNYQLNNFLDKDITPKKKFIQNSSNQNYTGTTKNSENSLYKKNINDKSIIINKELFKQVDEIKNNKSHEIEAQDQINNDINSNKKEQPINKSDLFIKNIHNKRQVNQLHKVAEKVQAQDASTHEENIKKSSFVHEEGPRFIQNFVKHLELTQQLQSYLQEKGLELLILPFFFSNFEGVGQWTYWKENSPMQASRERVDLHHLIFDLTLKNIGRLNIHLVKKDRDILLNLYCSKEYLNFIRKEAHSLLSSIRGLDFNILGIEVMDIKESANDDLSSILLDTQEPGSSLHIVT